MIILEHFGIFAQVVHITKIRDNRLISQFNKESIILTEGRIFQDEFLTLIKSNPNRLGYF